MEYHQDRFKDFSLMIYNNDELVALLPANKVGHELFSHQGLTYGGLLLPIGIHFDELKSMFKALVEFFKANHISSVILKPLPEFYNNTNSAEFLKVLHDYEPEIIKKNTILAIDYNSDYKIHKTKIKRYNKLKTNGLIIKEGQLEFEKFWNTILVKRLGEKHHSKPVHSLSEMHDLQSHFPDKIVQFNIYHDDEILAGITIFIKGKVVKSQYGMASEAGEKLNALDMLFVYLIHKYKDQGMQYFSMGTVNNNSKLGYSQGMLKQKQELGCTTFVQDILKVKIND